MKMSLLRIMLDLQFAQCLLVSAFDERIHCAFNIVLLPLDQRFDFSALGLELRLTHTTLCLFFAALVVVFLVRLGLGVVVICLGLRFVVVVVVVVPQVLQVAILCASCIIVAARADILIVTRRFIFAASSLLTR